MRRFILIVAAVAAMCSCTADNKRYTVKGQFVDCNSDSVWLISSLNGSVLTSAPMTDGRFELSGDVEVPFMARITTSQFGIGPACEVVVEPGEMELSMAPEMDSVYMVSGTKSNEGISNLKKMTFRINERIRANDGIIDNSINALIEDYENSIKSGLKDNLDNFFGLILVQSLADPDDPESTKIFLDKFPANLQKTEEWQRLNDEVNKLLSFGVGKPYLDFTQNDADGNPVTASKVIAESKNRYVLVDFWASWCGPCMRELPYLKEAYSQYSPKGFEIIGVSLDQDRDSWLEAIKTNEMNWVHVSDLQYWNNEVAQLYNIHSIPANYLIDCKTGLIVAKGLRGNQLSVTLADLLK